jgi:hypothetical protein
MRRSNYCSVYDFELMPYALGDVLTWNVQTAIRCENLGRERVDVYICVDERYPASIYQSDMVTGENCGLFFNELFGAFGTHPRLGSIFIDRRREDTLQRLRVDAAGDPASMEVLADYEHALANRNDEDMLIAYFTKYIYYHEQINAFAVKHGRIPLLRPSMGCEPDVAGLITRRLAGKRIVVIHLRMRRLDVGLRGEHTYARDSDFLEWYEFLREAQERFPDVQFVVLGRLQEKPLELLALPNVMSLRTYGLGLGHELTFMLRSDLFIGTSSGFAAMANFSELPYFITKMNRESCNAYRVPLGTERLPFATERQVLVYEPESRELLLRLLERGLKDVPPRSGTGPTLDPAIDVKSWEWERQRWLYPGATTQRFFTDETYREKETAFLVWPLVKEARAALRKGWKVGAAWTVLSRIERNFPQLCARFPEFLRARAMLAIERNDRSALRACRAQLEALAQEERSQEKVLRLLKRYAVWGFPFARRARFIWKNRRRIPSKLKRIMRRFSAALRSA